MNSSPAPQIVFLPSPAPAPVAARPWLQWIIAAALGFLASGMKLPHLPQLPPLPSAPSSPPATPPSSPPAAPPTAPPQDPRVAIARIQFDNFGCTATCIAPRRADGRYWVLTAAHCIPDGRPRGKMMFKDGRTVGLQVMAIDRESDCCWALTDTNTEVLPTLALAQKSPDVGAEIWHAGYGVDKPGNVEKGTVGNQQTTTGKTHFRLSVSSGDSGGPIILTATNEVVSTTCCTTEKGAFADVYGASVERIRKLLPTGVNDDVWIPREMPECKHAKQ